MERFLKHAKTRIKKRYEELNNCVNNDIIPRIIESEKEMIRDDKNYAYISLEYKGVLNDEIIKNINKKLKPDKYI